MYNVDRGRGSRRRGTRRRGGTGSSGSSRKPSEREMVVDTPPVKTPIILAKPPRDQQRPSSSYSTPTPSPSYSSPTTPSSSSAISLDRPIVITRSRDEARPQAPSGAYGSPPRIATREGTAVTKQQQQRHTTILPHPDIIQNRLAPLASMKNCIKIIDENQNWQEAAGEFMSDSSEFIVIGVLGSQGVGKSTILSLLAGNMPDDPQRQYVFVPQSREVRDVCEHQTTGIDMFLSTERLIFLDTQAVLSPSVLDKLIRADKKIPPEYTTAENCIEMQSLHQVAFLMTVCHVILVVQDWFTDMTLLRFLQTAEMLKPSSHSSSSHDSSPGQEENVDYFPRLVFVQNKATRDMYSIETFKWMQASLDKVFEKSKLKIKGAVTVAKGKLLPGLCTKNLLSDVNLYLLPKIDYESYNPEKSEQVIMDLPEYKGYPSFATLIDDLRRQIYSLPRDHLAHVSLTEKHWFNYAFRTWEAVKKSQLMAEYNRLLH